MKLQYVEKDKSDISLGDVIVLDVAGTEHPFLIVESYDGYTTLDLEEKTLNSMFYHSIASLMEDEFPDDDEYKVCTIASLYLKEK